MVTLSQDNYQAIWKWSKSGKFTVKFVYEHLTKRDEGPSYSRVWRAKREKQCLFVASEAKSNTHQRQHEKKELARRLGLLFLRQFEDTDHLFVCPISKVIWGVTALCFHQNDMPSSYDRFWP
jgi:predicted AAA+ superfamily ATPase